MHKTKFDVYLEICQKVSVEFASLGSDQLKPIAESFSNSIEQINVWVSENKFPASKSEIAKGLEQGINELPLLIEGIEPEFRSKAYSAYYKSVNSIIPDYFEKLATKIERIIKRGKIKSESEFYLLRNRLDQIEGDGTSEETSILKLLGKFESSA